MARRRQASAYLRTPAPTRSRPRAPHPGDARQRQVCEARFFLARRDGAPAGTIGAIVNSAYNEYHHTRIGHFHFFGYVDDREVSHALVDAALAWLRSTGMEKVGGPYGSAQDAQCAPTTAPASALATSPTSGTAA